MNPALARWLGSIGIQRLIVDCGGVPVAMDYRLPRGSGPFPAVMLLHGSDGPSSAFQYFGLVMQALARSGYASFFPRYFERTGDEQLGPPAERDKRIQEVYMQWEETAALCLEAVIRHERVDSRRIGLIGGSLGGFIAVGIAANRSEAACVIEFCGGIPEHLRGKVDTLPPLLVAHGLEDQVVPVARAEEALELCAEKRIEHEALLYPGEGHAFSPSAEADALKRCRAFLDLYLKG